MGHLKLRKAAVRMGLAAALAALPASAGEAPARLQAADRSGPYVLGANYPWVKYGLDFGASGFGQFGLSTDCGEGFRPERNPRFPEVHGVVSCERSEEQVHTGRFSLKAFVKISSSNPVAAEIATDLQDVAHLPQEATLDLASETVSVWVYAPAGKRGNPSNPNYVQLFVKDNSPEAIGLYSEASDGNGNIPEAGGWFKVSLAVTDFQGGFDPNHVRLLGVKIVIGGGSSADLETSIFVDQIESSHPDLAFGFEQPGRAQIDVTELSGAGVEALRWFVFADGRAAPEFDQNGYVTGLDPLFMRDFDTLLRLAREHGLFVVPVLFDFLLCGEPDEVNGVPLFGRADLIRDPQRRQSFLTNALDPILDRYGAAPEILAWEVINEPEWCLKDLVFADRPDELPVGGAVTTAEMQAFVGETARFIHDHPSTYRTAVTLGSASERYLDLWFGKSPDLGLDVCQFHLYNCEDCLDKGRSLADRHNCALGEFSALASRTDRTVLDYLEDTFEGGYAGAAVWSWRARDGFSPVGREAQVDLLSQIADFVASGPCLLGPEALCLNGGRFKVETAWKTRDGTEGAGQAVQLTTDTGYFWFFGSSNVELVVKVLDACAFNQRFWVFAGGLTDVEVTLRVTDTATGAVATYINPQGTAFLPIQDTSAFSTCSAPLPTNAMSSHPNVGPSSVLPLNGGRFRVTVDWTTPGGTTGIGSAVALSNDTGYFWFFSEPNVELVIKVLDACSFNERFWVFAGGLTNVEAVLTVEDLKTGARKTYRNPQGVKFLPIQDTDAFATCP